MCISSHGPSKEGQVLRLTGNSRSLGSQYRNFVAKNLDLARRFLENL
jgi:hypothetical protein